MWLSDRTLDHLRAVADEPDLSGTRYRLEETIGRGGMGRVYRARDTELDRDVALKVLHAHEAGAAGRLLAEARILARLEHPGIVPVHDAGTLPDGRVFCAMKLVRGKRLDALAAENVDLPERLRIFQRICETVAFAHAHGVLHRDLKPQNVMVGAFGEVLVLDWGIARETAAGRPDGTVAVSGIPSGDTAFTDAPSGIPSGDTAITDAPSGIPSGDTTITDALSGTASGDTPRSDDAAVATTTPQGGAPLLADAASGHRASPGARATEAGSRVGTPGWMAPEQEQGFTDRITARTDVFGLGAILRSLVAAAPIENGVKPPARLRAIIERATAPDPDARYADVQSLADDVARYLAGLSVSAYSEPFLERALRVARKYRTPILLVLTYLIMRVLFIVFADP